MPCRVKGAAGVLAQESSPERLREQVVVAVPGALIVERDDEQVAALELLAWSLPARSGR
jgi:hypothetical protein